MDSVLGIVFDKSKRLLLVKRRDVPVWVPPGGRIENSETPAVAVVREVWEESGFKVKVVRKIAVYTNKSRRKNHLFLCSVVSGRARLSNESKGVGFFPTDKLPGPYNPLIHRWLEDARLNKSRILRKRAYSVGTKILLKYFYKNPVVVLRFFLLKVGLRINT